MDWSNFYLGTAGAAATLTGLLFVAVQFNLERVKRNSWALLAEVTYERQQTKAR